MRAPLGEQGRPGFRVTADRGKQFRACLQLRALPAGLGGAFDDDRPPPFPGFDGIEVGGKPQTVQQGADGGLGPRQIGFARVCHASVAG